MRKQKTRTVKRERSREDPWREKEFAKEKDRKILSVMQYAVENKRKDNMLMYG
jgi:hypothetical protein